MWKIVLPLLAAVFAVLGLVGGQVGGWQNIDVNDEGARNALDFAILQHNRGSNGMYLSKVAMVFRVQRQLVAGLKYRITAKLGKTSCRKGYANEVCPFHPDAKFYQCTFEVWSQLDNMQVLLKQTC